MAKMHSIKPFLVFHLSVGIRLALRKLAPILAVAFAAYYLLRPELFNTVFAALLRTRSLIPGLVSAVLSLSIAGMAAPRVCLGLNGWICHLPASGLMHRRLAGIAVFVAQLPVLLVLAALALIVFMNFEVPPGLYLLGLPVMGLAAGLCVLPVHRKFISRPLTAVACVLSTSGHWTFLIGAVILLAFGDLAAGNLSPPRKSQISRKAISGSFLNAAIAFRAIRLRILVPYLPSLFVLGLTSIFLTNNVLTSQQSFRAVCFGGILAMVVFCAFAANLFAVRRPPWPWARSLPWPAKQRIFTDSSLIGLVTIPNLVLVALIKTQAIWPVVVSLPPLAVFASLTVRRAFEYQLGAVGRILIIGVMGAVLVCLIPLVSILFLGLTPLVFKYAVAEERQQKVSRWLEMHHLAAGDSLSWSQQ